MTMRKKKGLLLGKSFRKGKGSLEGLKKVWGETFAMLRKKKGQYFEKVAPCIKSA